MESVEDVIEKAKKLYTRKGYFERFFELCINNPGQTYKAVYHMLESEYIMIFGQNRYDNYESFKSSKSQFLKSN